MIRKGSILASMLALLLGVALAIGSSAFAANPPAVGTGSPGEITSNTAVLTGAVDPEEEATTYAFQYGTSTQYSGQTATHSVDPPTTYETVTALVTGLQSGTIYHFRVLATNANGNSWGRDVTFKTAGMAPPFGSVPVAVTGPATVQDAHDAILTGMLNPSASTVRYYFQLGTQLPYDVQTISQTLLAGRPLSVQAHVGGLQGNHVFHYRLVAVSESGAVSAGMDQTFVTTPSGANLKAIRVSVSPRSQRRLPDTVTVSGRLLLASGIPRSVACHGFVDVGFRAHTIAVQFLRAGIHPNCTFRLRVRFSVRQRLLGGRVSVHVVFPGNGVLQRIAAPTQTIQIG